MEAVAAALGVACVRTGEENAGASYGMRLYGERGEPEAFVGEGAREGEVAGSV